MVKRCSLLRATVIAIFQTQSTRHICLVQRAYTATFRKTVNKLANPDGKELGSRPTFFPTSRLRPAQLRPACLLTTCVWLLSPLPLYKLRRFTGSHMPVCTRYISMPDQGANYETVLNWHRQGYHREVPDFSFHPTHEISLSGLINT